MCGSSKKKNVAREVSSTEDNNSVLSVRLIAQVVDILESGALDIKVSSGDEVRGVVVAEAIRHLVWNPWSEKYPDQAVFQPGGGGFMSNKLSQALLFQAPTAIKAASGGKKALKDLIGLKVEVDVQVQDPRAGVLDREIPW